MTSVYHGVILLVHQRNPSPASKQTCVEKRQISWRRILLKEWVSWPSRRVGTVTQAPHKCMRSMLYVQLEVCMVFQPVHIGH